MRRQEYGGVNTLAESFHQAGAGLVILAASHDALIINSSL